jgi:hypothetical protein
MTPAISVRGRSLPLGLALGVSRRSYYLGTALLAATVAAADGLALTADLPGGNMLQAIHCAYANGARANEDPDDAVHAVIQVVPQPTVILIFLSAGRRTPPQATTRYADDVPPSRWALLQSLATRPGTYRPRPA